MLDVTVTILVTTAQRCLTPVKVNLKATDISFECRF
jgi:hypothetical protein